MGTYMHENLYFFSVIDISEILSYLFVSNPQEIIKGEASKNFSDQSDFER